MRLLIVTQTVDFRHPILGFFHRWIEEFASHYESVIVIGQMEGQYDLPPNVEVLSLGKEDGLPTWKQILRYWKLLFSRRKDYDHVLVHMTPIWVVLGADLLWFLRKPIYLWYEARGKRWPLRVSLLGIRKVFSASRAGMPLRTRKSVIVGHGIDTDMFALGSEQRQEGDLIAVGRITRAKKLDVILEALTKLPSSTRLRIAGVTMTEDDDVYRGELESFIALNNLQDRVEMGSLTQEELIPYLQKAQCLVHASETSLDKAVLEAMSCGCPVVSCSSAVTSVLPLELQATEEDLAEKIESVLSVDEDARRSLGAQLRNIIVEHHRLSGLIKRLVKEMR